MRESRLGGCISHERAPTWPCRFLYVQALLLGFCTQETAWPDVCALMRYGPSKMGRHHSPVAHESSSTQSDSVLLKKTSLFRNVLGFSSHACLAPPLHHPRSGAPPPRRLTSRRLQPLMLAPPLLAQQPWVRRPGRGRQRRAWGQPASEHARLVRSRTRCLRRAREINGNGEEISQNRHGKNDSVGVHVCKKAADRRRTHGRNDCTRSARVCNLLLLGLGSICGRVSLLLRSRGGSGSVGRGGGLCTRK